jgi:ribosome-binding protein aMBF1 (putative translation factor)
VKAQSGLGGLCKKLFIPISKLRRNLSPLLTFAHGNEDQKQFTKTRANMYPNLKLEIFKRGIRQNYLARVMGMREAILSKIINGYREPSDVLKQRIADHLQVDKAWLFEKYIADSSTGGSNHAEPSEESENGDF